MRLRVLQIKIASSLPYKITAASPADGFLDDGGFGILVDGGCGIMPTVPPAVAPAGGEQAAAVICMGGRQ